MKYAVIIPIFNCGNYLRFTLESLNAQTYQPDEVIIVDDGSTDNSVEIAESYGFKVYKQKNLGPASARNKAVELSVSDWIIFLDGDDLLEPDRIKVLNDVICNDPSLSMIANDEYEGHIQGPWVEKKLHTYYTSQIPLYDQLLDRCFLSTSAMAMKRSLYLDTGGMDVSLRSAQDYDFWLRASRCAKFTFIPQTLSRYVIRPESVTANYLRRLQCLKIIIQKNLSSYKLKKLVRRVLVIHFELLLLSIKSRQYVVALKIYLSLFFSLLRFLTRII